MTTIYWIELALALLALAGGLVAYFSLKAEFKNSQQRSFR